MFAKAFLTKEMRNKIADMTDEEIKKLARDLAAKMNQPGSKDESDVK